MLRQQGVRAFSFLFPLLAMTISTTPSCAHKLSHSPIALPRVVGCRVIGNRGRESTPVACERDAGSPYAWLRVIFVCLVRYGQDIQEKGCRGVRSAEKGLGDAARASFAPAADSTVGRAD